MAFSWSPSTSPLSARKNSRYPEFPSRAWNEGNFYLGYQLKICDQFRLPWPKTSNRPIGIPSSLARVTPLRLFALFDVLQSDTVYQVEGFTPRDYHRPLLQVPHLRRGFQESWLLLHWRNSHPRALYGPPRNARTHSIVQRWNSSTISEWRIRDLAETRRYCSFLNFNSCVDDCVALCICRLSLNQRVLSVCRFLLKLPLVFSFELGMNVPRLTTNF